MQYLQLETRRQLQVALYLVRGEYEKELDAEVEYIRVLYCLQEKYPHRTARIDRLRQKLGGIS